VQDITERKQAETEIFNKNKELLAQQGELHTTLDNLQTTQNELIECDIFCTGSNAKMLSSELSTYWYPPQRDHLWQNIPLHSFARNK